MKSSAPMELLWSEARFEDLGVWSLYDVLRLRCEVFILEQGPYLDPDGLDPHAWHLLGRDSQGALRAYLRVVDPGYKFEEPSIGRVIVQAIARGHQVGRRLMVAGLDLCERHWPGRAVRISAQAHLAPFYGSLGFSIVGEPYLEDGIAHVEMLRPGSLPAVPPESSFNPTDGVEA